jgi:hypothetical protein
MHQHVKQLCSVPMLNNLSPDNVCYLQIRKLTSFFIRCGHEFCYSCNAAYHHGNQTCQCSPYWANSQHDMPVPQPNTPHQMEMWSWDSFDCIPTNTMEGYSEQERAQLQLIQRFLSGGFSLSDHPCEDPPPPRCSESYIDTMKDLHQLPWLERFVSMISDSYNEDYIQ